PPAVASENSNNQAAKPGEAPETKRATVEQAAAKKTEKTAATTIQGGPTPPAPQTPPRAGEGHSDRATVETDEPEVPEGDVPNRRRRDQPRTKVLPGGAVIRNFPDGSRLIISPDGKRVFQDKYGKTQILYPGEKPNRPKVPQP